MYYLVIIQNDTTQAVYSYETLDAAISMFHTELAYRGDDRNKTVCVILNKKGELVKSGSMKEIKGDKSLENVFMELEG